MTTETGKLPALPRHHHSGEGTRFYAERQVLAFADLAVSESIARDRAAQGDWHIVEAWVHGGTTAELKLQRNHSGPQDAVLDMTGQFVKLYTRPPVASDAFGVCECGCGRKVCNRCGNEVDDGPCPSRDTPPAGDAPRGLNTDRRMAAVETLIEQGWKWIDGKWTSPGGDAQAAKERDFLVEEYERAVQCGPQGYLHCAMHLFNAITNARIDAKLNAQARVDGIVVDQQGVRFGPHCWISHTQISGRSAEALNEGRGVISRRYMEWVQSRLAAALQEKP